VHTFLEWEELLGGTRDEFDFETLSSSSAVAVAAAAPDFSYLCGAERGEVAYLNQPAVREALHVCSEAECGVFPGHADDRWTAPYNRTEYHEGDMYKEFVDRGLRVMIYSGDTDGCIPYSGTAEWITALKLPTVESWRPWTLDNATQMAGYVTTYNHPVGTPGSFLFVTVRGAGHMVPRYR
jgi:serine carboxypeptidase-like clade 2